MRWLVALVIACVAACLPVRAQGVVGDLLAGKLVDPKVGQWAWYDLNSGRDSKKFVVRQAVVGEEKVARKTGYWVEFEIVPEVGYRVIYKMLLTGPASDPRNIVRVIEKTGPEPAVELDVAAGSEAESDSKSKSAKELVGEEEIATLDGVIRAEHYKVQQDNQTMDLWINDDIKPTGIVKLESVDGRMMLRNHGVGGEFAKTVIQETPISADEAAQRRATQQPAAPEVETRTNVGNGSDSGN